MTGFPTASATSTCGALSQRALSTAAEIDEIARHGPAEHPQLQKLRFLATKLQQFRQHADQLQHCLLDSSVVSERLQGVISRALGDCDASTAVVDKQVKRAGPLTVPRLSSDAMLRTGELLVSYSRLFIFITQLLSMPDASSQDSKLDNAVGQQLVDSAKQSAASIMSGIDFLGAVEVSTAGEGSNSGFPEGTSSSTAVETSPPPSDDEPPALPQRPRKSGMAKGISTLTNTLKAVTAGIRPRPEPFVSPLCQAASRGNIPHVKGLLAQGANINGRNEEGNTALICAITFRQSEAAIFLVESGANVTLRDSARKRRPPLFHALQAGDCKTAEILLQKGARVNERNLVGQPYFVDIVLSEPLEMARLCLKYGADANAKDITGRAIICHTTTRGNVPLTCLLLDHGADPNSRDVIGNTLLLATIRNARLQDADKIALVHSLLTYGAKPNEPDTWGVTALAHAAAADNVELLGALLDSGADPNRPVHGDSLLVNAIYGARWDQVWALVERGRADPNIADARGRTPLRAAMESQNPDAVQLLLEHGAETNLAGRGVPYIG